MLEPLSLGPFVVHCDGTLIPRDAGRHPALHFAWRGRRCEVALSAGGLALTTIAGRIPSTAEPDADRASAFETVARLPGSLPPGWQLRLLPDHRIQLDAAGDCAQSPTAIGLIAAMVRFALALDPYLDRLDSASAGPSGKLNI